MKRVGPSKGKEPPTGLSWFMASLVRGFWGRPIPTPAERAKTEQDLSEAQELRNIYQRTRDSYEALIIRTSEGTVDEKVLLSWRQIADEASDLVDRLDMTIRILERTIY